MVVWSACKAWLFWSVSLLPKREWQQIGFFLFCIRYIFSPMFFRYSFSSSACTCALSSFVIAEDWEVGWKLAVYLTLHGLYSSIRNNFPSSYKKMPEESDKRTGKKGKDKQRLVWETKQFTCIIIHFFPWRKLHSGNKSRCLPKLFQPALFFARLSLFEMMLKALWKPLMLGKGMHIGESGWILVSIFPSLAVGAL